MRILYVEDNPANLFLVQRVARMGNHEVINYSEGQIALDNFLRDKPDLVLMDIQLPGSLTGLDVVRKLREDGHKTPIIAVTAYAMIGDRERCLQTGCNAYIAKPLPVVELVEMIKKYEAQAVPAVPSAPTSVPAPTSEAPVAAESKPSPEKPLLVESPVSSPLPKAEPKLETDVKLSSNPTEPEKPVEMAISVNGGQNTPSTLSSNHQ